MSRLATSFILGYHGCDQDTANAIVNRHSDFLWSEKSYDWLGAGIYFWESDVDRAWEWAHEQVRRGRYSNPAVVGAAIDLGECLDLNQRQNVALLRSMYDEFNTLSHATGKPMPQNEGVGASDEDRRLRKLDCAVINHLHKVFGATDAPGIKPFDTVRGMFTEGDPVYPGCGFTERAHVQIAVRNPDCIKGVFYPR